MRVTRLIDERPAVLVQARDVRGEPNKPGDDAPGFSMTGYQ
jgi:hypothetical protein